MGYLCDLDKYFLETRERLHLFKPQSAQRTRKKANSTQLTVLTILQGHSPKNTQPEKCKSECTDFVPPTAEHQLRLPEGKPAHERNILGLLGFPPDPVRCVPLPVPILTDKEPSYTTSSL